MMSNWTTWETAGAVLAVAFVATILYVLWREVGRR
jgi:hypothetical protein